MDTPDKNPGLRQPYIVHRLSGRRHFWTGDGWALDVRDARYYLDGPELERAMDEAASYEGHSVAALPANWVQ